MGGETAIVRMSHAYSELPEPLREKLERLILYPARWTLAEIAERYGASEENIREFCAQVGLPVVERGGPPRLLLPKPSVVLHARTGRRSLQVNRSAELRGFTSALMNRLARRYAGRCWSLHRVAWKDQRVMDLLLGLESTGGDMSVRRTTSRSRLPHEPDGPRLADVLDGPDVQLLADAAARHCSMFPWRENDLLILDNCQMLHAGMPGLGSRELRVVLCTPIPMPYPIASGLLNVDSGVPFETVVARLEAFIALCNAPALPRTPFMPA
jgi:hypothetical protein